jgi:hypothetical protein
MTTSARRSVPPVCCAPKNRHAIPAALAMLTSAFITAIAWAVAMPYTATASDKQPSVRNPLQYEGRPFSCPDPDVFNWARLYVASCTSDYGQDNPLPSGGMGPLGAAFPIYVSRDLEHWRFRSFVFPPGRHPEQALASFGSWPGGRYWSPEIHHLGSYYEVYFSAVLNLGTIAWINRNYRQHLLPGTCGLFVAWSKRLFGGSWQSRLLHFPGQFNHVPGNAADDVATDYGRAQAASNSLELSGGVIDPTVAQDPRTGTLIMAWAKQPNFIFIGQLAADGLRMDHQVHLALAAGLPWECDPDARGRHCVDEGPVLWWDRQNQQMDMFFNAGSTWKGTYKVGVAVSTDLRRWYKYPRPILKSGNGLFGPGIGAQPFTGPGGQLDLAFHVQLRPSHESQARFLAVAQLGDTPATKSFPFVKPGIANGP